MEPRDGNGSGDSPTPKKKRASSTKRVPSARKRAANAVKSAEQETEPATVREEAPQAAIEPAQTEPTEAGRAPADVRGPQQRTSGERPVDLEGRHDGTFGDRDADRAADVAADLKSWMDTRREDRDHRGEVL